MDLENLRVYNQAMQLGEKVWNVVDQWNYFQKDTVGKQLVRAVDSVAANLSEGFGRCHFKESKNFGYYSRGSLFETKTWLTNAHNRKLIETGNFDSLICEVEVIGKILNNYIKSIGNVSEPEETYNLNSPNNEFPTSNDLMT